jgi:hypothetical protein
MLGPMHPPSFIEKLREKARRSLIYFLLFLIAWLAWGALEHYFFGQLNELVIAHKAFVLRLLLTTGVWAKNNPVLCILLVAVSYCVYVLISVQVSVGQEGGALSLTLPARLSPRNQMVIVKGVKVRVTAPLHEAEKKQSPCWVPAMDKYNGRVYLVDVATSDGWLKLENVQHWFRREWVEMLSEEDTRQVGAGD